MYFAKSDIELLRLAGWCKNLPADLSGMFLSQVSGCPVFDPAGVGLLIQAGLLSLTKGRPSIRLRKEGHAFLRYLGHRYHEDTKGRYYERRVQASRLLLTFWRAGFDVFASSLDDLGRAQVFLLSMAARRYASSDVWGGAIFWGLAGVRNNACACYYVEDGQELTLNYRGERFTLDKAAQRFSGRSAMLLAGSDYAKLARAVRNNTPSKPPEKESELPLPRLRQTVNHPLYLLECGDAGALQLVVMSIPDYRKRLANAMFRTQDLASRVTALPSGVTGADGMLAGVGPWVVAFDMDIHRIDRAYRQTIGADVGKLTILCLNERAGAALRILYGVERTNIVVVPSDRLLNAFGELRLHEPEHGVYTDAKGGIMDAAHIPMDRKVGE